LYAWETKRSRVENKTKERFAGVRRTNFRPISNLKSLFEVIEKVAAGQLLEHLANNNLEEPFQSAYKRFHSAETPIKSTKRYSCSH
jgi:hypothetical protein